jgi:putative redox protein
MHSPQDEVVSIHNAERIFRAVPHPRSFVSLHGADHLLSNAEHGSYAADMIGAWARHVADGQAAQADRAGREHARDAGGAGASASAADTLGAAGAGRAAALQPAEGYTVVAQIGREPYAVQMSNGEHALVADEPESVGGGDRGGNPFVYLLSALGSCTAMTVRMYADRKGWNLEGATVHLRHRKVKPEEIEIDPNSTKAKQVDHIEMQIELTGELSEQERTRLIEIAHHCPVHRTLTSPTRIDVTEI